MDVLRISRRRRVAGMIAAAIALVAAGVVTAAPPASASAGILKTRLLSRFSYQCLDLLGSNSSNGATIGQWSCNGQSNQIWNFVHADQWGETGKLVSEYSDKCMDVAGANYEPWTRIVQWRCEDYAGEQLFTWTKVGRTGSGDDIVTIHPQDAPHMCFDMLGATHDYGAPLGLWHCVEGAYEQHFIVDSIEWRPRPY